MGALLVVPNPVVLPLESESIGGIGIPWPTHLTSYYIFPLLPLLLQTARALGRGGLPRFHINPQKSMKYLV